jgi:hypothetical protein
MMVIEKVSRIDFLKDHEITNLKPQFPVAPIITKDVPSTSAPPRYTHFGSAAPPSVPPPPWVVLLGCSRVCLLGAMALISARTCS